MLWLKLLGRMRDLIHKVLNTADFVSMQNQQDLDLK